MFGGGEIDLRGLPEHAHGAVPQNAELPVERMSAAEEAQDGGSSRRQFVHGNGQADIAASKFQPGLQSVNGFVAPSGGGVHLRTI